MSELASFAILDLFEKLDNVSTNLFFNKFCKSVVLWPKSNFEWFFKGTSLFFVLFFSNSWRKKLRSWKTKLNIIQMSRGSPWKIWNLEVTNPCYGSLTKEVVKFTMSFRRTRDIVFWMRIVNYSFDIFLSGIEVHSVPWWRWNWFRSRPC